MSEGATELYDAIYYATGKGCDVVFFPDVGWEAIGVEARLHHESGSIVKTASGRISYKELIYVSKPADALARCLREATRKVLSDG
jgi:hypothetical protein